jgi:hypothetical protein
MDIYQKQQIFKKLKEFNVDSFYYFTYIENLKSILENGILPKNEVIKRNVEYQSFAEETVQARRHCKHITLTNHQNYTIHDVVPLYLVTKTPTLFARRSEQSRIIFIRIFAIILQDNAIEFAFTDGNAASKDSKTYNDMNYLSELPWNILRWNVYWQDYPDGKRKRNSEFMIFPYVPVDYIAEFGVSNAETLCHARDILTSNNCKINVQIQNEWFFN